MTNTPAVGDPAPDFELPEASEKKVRLREAVSRGPVVLVFYPTDWGMICTMEMKRFQAMLPDLEAAGATLLAVSVNTTTSHRAWKEHLGITFDLLSDPDGEVVRRYGLMIGETDLMRGRSTRAAFVIGPDLMVRYAWKAPDISFQPDYDALLAVCRELRSVAQGQAVFNPVLDSSLQVDNRGRTDQAGQGDHRGGDVPAPRAGVPAGSGG